jgi:hypothetical protein
VGSFEDCVVRARHCLESACPSGWGIDAVATTNRCVYSGRSGQVVGMRGWVAQHVTP